MIQLQFMYIQLKEIKQKIIRGSCFQSDTHVIRSELTSFRTIAGNCQPEGPNLVIWISIKNNQTNVRWEKNSARMISH